MRCRKPRWRSKRADSRLEPFSQEPIVSALDSTALLGATLLVVGMAFPVISRNLAVALALQAAGVALIGSSGALVLFGAPVIGAEFRSSLDPALGIDGLTGFFLATLALAAVPALIFSRDYLAGAKRSRALVALCGLFLISLVGVVVARDPSLFLAS
jgi:formate hydrogenlyase subunit 3/multisubunit Na+/H+ antiporter MnhD subunit